jgi:NAD(P) transhydrogenase subunit alpha
MVLGAPQDVAVNLLIFVLATLLGLVLVRGVSKLLHTPLMSLTNMISSVSLVAALIVLGEAGADLGTTAALATIAVVLASANAVGGFVITDRILKIFGKGRRGKGGRP